MLLSVFKPGRRPWRLAHSPLAALRLLLALLLLTPALAGCTTQLAPSYDVSIATGVQNLNQQAMVFFASVAGSADKSTYPQRQATYTQLIGQTNALVNLAKARPDPASLPAFVESKLKDWTKVKDFTAPTADILAKIATGFTTMQQADQQSGLSSVEVQAFQGSFTIDIQQALKYESALKRTQ